MKNIRALRPKVYHRGDKIRADGAVSALCFSSPRPIDLGRAMWTTVDTAVTCSKCLRLLREKRAATAGNERPLAVPADGSVKTVEPDGPKGIEP